MSAGGDTGHAGADLEQLRAAAGRGYRREWALFRDYATATDQPCLPTTLTALTGFLTQLPCAPATRARRVAAIAAAHRRSGHLPPADHASARTPPSPGPARPAGPEQLLAGCPTRGWPEGFLGRRDGFLIVVTATLGHTRTRARSLRTDDITLSPPKPTENTAGAGEVGEALPQVRDQPVPTSADPRGCAACAVIRWLEILGVAEGYGRGSARMHLSAAHAPLATSTHQHTLPEPQHWRIAAQPLPAIDQHGWIDDYRPLSIRSISARLALAHRRVNDPPPPPTSTHQKLAGQSGDPGIGAPRGGRPRTLAEVLAALDEVADQADALNDRIKRLLAGDQP